MSLFSRKKKRDATPISDLPEAGGADRQTAPTKLQLLITIVDKVKAEFYADLIQSFDVNTQMIMLARGTAKTDMLNYLGLSDTDKSVIFSIVREDRLDDLVYVIDNKFASIKGGKGVCISIPFTSMIGTSVYGFLCNDARTIRKEEKNER